VTKIAVHKRRKERVLVYLKKVNFWKKKRIPSSIILLQSAFSDKKIGIGLSVCFSFWRTLHMQQVLFLVQFSS